MIGQLAERVRRALDRPVHVAFVDVLVRPRKRSCAHCPPTGRSRWCRHSLRADTTSVPTCPRMSRRAGTRRHRHRCARPVRKHSGVLAAAAHRMRLATRRFGGVGRGGYIGSRTALRVLPNCGDVVGEHRRPGRVRPSRPLGRRGSTDAVARLRGAAVPDASSLASYLLADGLFQDRLRTAAPIWLPTR